jgi:catechol 2,3-dioxygenase-like lactoylglutathione lyase family enzyme
MIDHLDHLVLTTIDEAACVDFYTRVLGMALESFIGGTPPVERKAFKFGNQKINLHVRGKEFEPKAHLPVPGALDLCFIATVPLQPPAGPSSKGRCCAPGPRGRSARSTCATRT